MEGYDSMCDTKRKTRKPMSKPKLNCNTFHSNKKTSFIYT